MLTERRYTITELEPYIDWLYFLHAWEMPMQGDESDALKEEAHQTLHALEADDDVSIKGRVALYQANAQGDDIVITDDQGSEHRFPCLRRQSSGSVALCLADFIRPAEQGIADRIGVFATAADYKSRKVAKSQSRKVNGQWSMVNSPDTFEQMMTQTLLDRLAEAAACRLHEEVRKEIWGYAPDESLTIREMQQERNQGIRPAVGYPSLPDQSINFLLAPLIKMDEMGITLTENGAMKPHASVSGLMIAHPEARYFAIGKIGNDQLADYAARRGLPIDRMAQFLGIEHGTLNIEH